MLGTAPADQALLVSKAGCTGGGGRPAQRAPPTEEWELGLGDGSLLATPSGKAPGKENLLGVTGLLSRSAFKNNKPPFL